MSAVKLRCCICGKRGEMQGAGLPKGWEGSPNLRQMTVTASDAETGAVMILALPVCDRTCGAKVEATTVNAAPPPFHPWAAKIAEAFAKVGPQLVIGK